MSDQNALTRMFDDVVERVLEQLDYPTNVRFITKLFENFEEQRWVDFSNSKYYLDEIVQEAYQKHIENRRK